MIYFALFTMFAGVLTFLLVLDQKTAIAAMLSAIFAWAYVAVDVGVPAKLVGYAVLFFIATFLLFQVIVPKLKTEVARQKRPE
ncbi:hypothetical protein [Limnohabitans lacus]|uniref:Uncharacterized protein n=1 Tax=Limnohabitans lacus TaxID=3045173 RepID=A0ABT6X6E3_9BURK|nr:hypothetical protein [Limnohabitans sp. HM2-2]MDI9233522.1 hypothetical protein [Limnohabitans sp. HM2-2]